MTSAPGISPNGMFWTTAIPRGSVHANPGKGRASLNVTDLAVVDAFNIVNVLSGGPNIPATVSFTCTWGGPGERVRFFNADVGFAGNYVQNTATVQWSASNADGYQFTSEPFSAGFSIVGRSRDDVFGPEPRRASAAVVPHSQCVTAA